MKKLNGNETVTLRQKNLSDGRISLYLDLYEKGKRKYEFLKLYIVPEVKKSDKDKNRQTMELAEAIRYRRQMDMANKRYGINTVSPSDVQFFPFFDETMMRKDYNTKKGWKTVLRLLHDYEKDDNISFSEITTAWVRGWKEYLEKKDITDGSRAVYMATLRCCLHKAVKEDIISRDPSLSIEKFRGNDTERMYLTLDEVRKLSQTPCWKQDSKNAFLFSCLTGLRYSDVIRLTWGDVHIEGKYTRLIYQQKKTRNREYLDISPQAVKLMGERGSKDELVFKLPNHSKHVNEHIRKWVNDAGIDKHITFHCARHTFATMMLSIGTDLYTVSKLLGHRDISTTQIYAKVMDKTKQAAVDAIPTVLV